MNIIVLDINSSRVRAAAASASGQNPIALDGSDPDLPLALSLEGRRVEVGHAGSRLCRRFPHLTVTDFLADLGSEREWSAGRHRLKAERALGFVFERIKPVLASAGAIILSLPAYLTRQQVGEVVRIARASKLAVSCTVASPIGLAAAAKIEMGFRGDWTTLEMDEHGLSCSRGKTSEMEMQLSHHSLAPGLGVRQAKEEILNGIAELCVRQSRRDFRDSGSAEQDLYDQLDDVLEAATREEMIEVVIRTSHWCQNLILEPAKVQAMAKTLTDGIVDLVQDQQSDNAARPAILLNAVTAKTPGLVPALLEASKEGTLVRAFSEESIAAGLHAAMDERLLRLGSADPWDRIALSAASSTPRTERAVLAMKPR
jgi:hypothetical protein